MKSIKWENFDPSWLTELAENQIPEKPEIIESIRVLKEVFWESKAYAYFVNGSRPNQSGSEWQFQENIVLNDKKHGEIVLDILQENRIGGIEFLKRL